jgi:hypothetical protein
LKRTQRESLASSPGNSRASSNEDRGGVFGVKFKPGGFYPFVKWPLSRLTNGSMSLEDAFGIDGSPLESAIL